eukprot:m.206991 g.206991  ORF g.206991 m.206991 type:complete len:78 (-) comp18510_c0_seq4:109-342(-)
MNVVLNALGVEGFKIYYPNPFSLFTTMCSELKRCNRTQCNQAQLVDWQANISQVQDVLQNVRRQAADKQSAAFPTGR